MRIDRNNIDIVFRRINPEMVAKCIIEKNSKISRKRSSKNTHFADCSDISEPLFVNLALNNSTGYSKDERREQYLLLLEKMDGEFCVRKSVYNLLYRFAEETLITDRYLPVCKYSEILKWQDTTHLLGQDMFTTIFLAQNDCVLNTETEVFSWDPIVKSDNRRLNKTLERGIAENHYHLNGSTQSFPINWILIMNNPEAIKLIDNFGDNLDSNISFGASYNSVSWKVKLLWAVYIRQYLFRKIEGYTSDSNKENSKNEAVDFLSASELELTNIHIIWLRRSVKLLKYSLGYRADFDTVVLDYALKSTMNPKNYNYNRVLAGERYFLYKCFCCICKEQFCEIEENLFYLYLLIKSQWRGEFIQLNSDVGFQNFADYQNRKSFFYKQKTYEDYAKEAYRISLNGVLRSQPIISLEARIMPNIVPFKLKNTIDGINSIYRSFENYLDNKESETTVPIDYTEETTDCKYSFIIHYPKSRKNTYGSQSAVNYPRNYYTRCQNRLYTDSLLKLLTSNKEMRDAIIGIDACSNEIGCRPETFATDFRCLRVVIPQRKKSVYENNETPAQLFFTYHAGEDFLNITDGIRTIDEAIKFFNMRHGDRIGHALALGIDPGDYYKSKNYQIITTKQNALDDEIWLLYRSSEMNIVIEKELEKRLLYHINERMNYIYGDIARKNDITLDPFNYYCSWKLRGDDPQLYSKGRFEDNREFILSRYEQFMVNDNLKSKTIRNNKNATFLYYAYHYDKDSKNRGDEIEVIKINEQYIKLVEQIQKCFQKTIAQRGLMIECNPTSNLLIGTFKRYDLHPITNFNNLSLELDEKKKKECAQISVSINTDDQGVFDTSLSNEYALMASALENKKDSLGNKVYSASQVYNYLDSVRLMGIEQAFKSKNNAKENFHQL